MKRDANGAVLVTVVDGTSWTGLYAVDGSMNVYDASSETSIGLYHPCGAIRVTAVNNTDKVGLYAANGSYNVVQFIQGQKNQTGAILVNGLVIDYDVNDPLRVLQYTENGFYANMRDETYTLKTNNEVETGSLNDFFTYTTTTPKLVRQSDGIFAYQPHNLVLNSDSAPSQTVTVIAGFKYYIAAQGTGTVSFTGAATGSITAGNSTVITASTTSLVLTCDATIENLHVARHPVTPTYVSTTVDRKYNLPFHYLTDNTTKVLKVEEGANDLLSDSRTFATWTNIGINEALITSASNSILLDQQVAQLDTTAGAGLKRISKTYTKAASAITYTFQGFLKGNVFDYATLYVDSGSAANNAYIIVRFSTGTIELENGAGTFSLVRSYIEPCANGFYFCSVTFTTGTETSVRCEIRAHDTAALSATTGGAGLGVFADCVNLIQYPTRSSPIIGHTASNLRSNDIITFSSSSVNYTQGQEGTFLFDWQSAESGVNKLHGILGFQGVNGTSMYANTTTYYAYDGVNIVTIGSRPSNTRSRGCVTWDNTGYTLAANGTVGTLSSTALSFDNSGTFLFNNRLTSTLPVGHNDFYAIAYLADKLTTTQAATVTEKEDINEVEFFQRVTTTNSASEPTPNLTNFKQKWQDKTSDVTVVMTGTSITARSTEYNSPRADASTRPPLLHSNNNASLIWDKIKWDGQEYRRYDSGYFTESVGTWATASNLAGWDDDLWRDGLTRYSTAAAAVVSFLMPSTARQFNFIYRTDSTGGNSTITVSGGNSIVEVFNGSSWVEANGYTLSFTEPTPVTRNIDVPNPDDNNNIVVINTSDKGNTTYQKRLKMRFASTASNQTITLTRVTGRITYWGVEWSTTRDYMITLINAARGSHHTRVNLNDGRALQQYQENEMWSFNPDLIIAELLHNDGAGIATTGPSTRHANVVNNWIFNTSYELSMASRATALGLNPDYLLWTSTLGSLGGAIDTDGSLIEVTTTDAQTLDALDMYTLGYNYVVTNYPATPIVNQTANWVEAGGAIYKETGLWQGTQASGLYGRTLLADGTHPNDTGSKLVFNSLVPYFSFTGN